MNIQQYYDRFEAAQKALNIANGLGQPFRGRTLGLYNKHKSALRHAQSGTKPAKRYAPNFWATVQGINCGVAITYVDTCPRGYFDIEFKLINDNGYHMEFLHKKASEDELLYIHRECEKIANKEGWQ